MKDREKKARTEKWSTGDVSVGVNIPKYEAWMRS